MPGQACSSSEKRRGPSERSWTSSAVHFEPMISAEHATAQVASWTGFIVRTAMPDCRPVDRDRPPLPHPSRHRRRRAHARGQPRDRARGGRRRDHGDRRHAARPRRLADRRGRDGAPRRRAARRSWSRPGSRSTSAPGGEIALEWLSRLPRRGAPPVRARRQPALPARRDARTTAGRSALADCALLAARFRDHARARASGAERRGAGAPGAARPARRGRACSSRSRAASRRRADRTPRRRSAALPARRPGLAHLLASDAHHASVRAVGMAAAAEAVGGGALGGVADLGRAGGDRRRHADPAAPASGAAAAARAGSGSCSPPKTLAAAFGRVARSQRRGTARARHVGRGGGWMSPRDTCGCSSARFTVAVCSDGWPSATSFWPAFRWIDGHADVWRLFYDRELFRVPRGRAGSSVSGRGITKVAGIEARGFILGAAVALELRTGFVAIRKEGGIFPGDKLTSDTPPD